MFSEDVIDQHMFMFEATEHLVRSFRNARSPRRGARHMIVNVTSPDRREMRAALFDMLWPEDS